MEEGEVEGGTGSHVEELDAPTSRCDGVQLTPWSSQDLETREEEALDAERREAEALEAERRDAEKERAKEELADRLTNTILAELLRDVLGQARSRVSDGPDQGAADGADGADGEAGEVEACVPPSSGVGYGVLIAAEEGCAGGTEVQEIPEVGAVGCQVQTCSLWHALTLMLTLALVLPSTQV